MQNTDIITGYHAHIYFDAETPSEQQAWRLHEAASKYFAKDIEAKDVYIGRFHKQPVGPHTTGMFMLAFPPEKFRNIVQWLQLNAVGLNILIHPETGDDLKDHRDYPLWLGKPQRIDYSKL